jgi:hypothetical protein
MLTAVDHIVLGVDDLSSGVRIFEGLGFHVSRPGPDDSHPISRYVVFGDFYLELQRRTNHSEQGRPSDPGLMEIAFRSDDLEVDISRAESTGLAVSDVVVDAIDGAEGWLTRRSASVDLYTPVRLVEPDHDPEARRAFLAGPTIHPNTARVLERTYFAVESIERDLRLFEVVLGMTAPEPEMGTVIMSLMSVFHIGDIGMAIAEPRGPGPTADALESNGPGLFQVLFRAEHLDEAARLMVENGMPEPERGTRLSGESALLVRPSVACGVFVALAGPI